MEFTSYMPDGICYSEIIFYAYLILLPVVTVSIVLYAHNLTPVKRDA